MSFSLSRSLATRLVIVLLAGLVLGSLLSGAALAETPSGTLGRVSGLVLDRSNQPLAGATVTLTDSSRTLAGSTDTDGQGRWSTTVPQGDYDLAVTARQDGHILSAKVRRYTVGADTKLNLILAGDPNERRVGAAGARDETTGGIEEDSSPMFTAAAETQSSGEMVTFSGRVLDADGNPVVSGVTIWLNQPQTYFYRDTVVAEDGSFSLEVLPDTYTLTMYTGLPEEDDDCYGCTPERIPVKIHAYQVENVLVDSNRQETIRLPRPSYLTVTVVDPDNRPVAGAWVSNLSNPGHPAPIAGLLFPGAATKVFTTVEQLTGADGTVDLEFIPGVTTTSVSVEPPPGTALPSVTPFPADASRVTIQLQDGPTLYGRILRADGTRLGATDAYLRDDSGRSYPFGFTPDGYSVTAPAGRYRMFLGVSHDEEGESSDYRLWSLESEPFDLTGDRAVDLTIPFGYARLLGVDDQGEPVEVETPYETVSQTVTIAGGIDVTATTQPEPAGYNSTKVPVIGPSITSETYVDHTLLPGGVYVAPGEDTIIAITPGMNGSGDDDSGSSTTTTTTTTNSTVNSGTSTTTPTTTTPNPGAGTAATTPATAGYWALSSDGKVYNFGEAAHHGNATAGAVDLEPTPSGKGYWTLNKDGLVQASGDAANLGAVQMSKLAKGEAPAALSATPSGRGYWVFTNRGRAVPFGDAPFLGDVSDVKLNGPVLGSVATPTGKGYYMVASDGGIFAFGDAKFEGSMGATKLNAPVQSLVPDSDGKGYWLVASDGGIFAFDAPFKGSLGGVKLNKPVVGMVRYGDGYLMVGADGGIFNFSSAPFVGSLGDKPPASPMVAVAALP